MSKTIRLTSTYDGFKPGSIITVDDAVAAQLLAGGVNASADLAGGKAAYKQVQQSSMVPLPSGPAPGSLGANETTEITLPPNFFLTVSGSAGAEGSAEVIDSTGSVSTPVQLRTAAVTFGSYQDERKVRLYANVGRFSYSSTPFGGVRLSPDSSGNMGIVGIDGKGIAIGGGNTDTTSPHYPAARAVMRIASVSQIRLITANSSNSFSPRVAHAEKNRKRVTFKNPATNTVSFQLGLTQNDNSNRNQSFTTSYTIAPGEELVCWYDENQWYARQTGATAVANQYLMVETEVNV